MRSAPFSTAWCSARTRASGMTRVRVAGGELKVQTLEVAPGTALRVQLLARDIIVATQMPQHLERAKQSQGRRHARSSTTIRVPISSPSTSAARKSWRGSPRRRRASSRSRRACPPGRWSSRSRCADVPLLQPRTHMNDADDVVVTDSDPTTAFTSGIVGRRARFSTSRRSPDRAPPGTDSAAAAPTAMTCSISGTLGFSRTAQPTTTMVGERRILSRSAASCSSFSAGVRRVWPRPPPRQTVLRGLIQHDQMPRLHPPMIGRTPRGLQHALEVLWRRAGCAQACGGRAGIDRSQ